MHRPDREDDGRPPTAEDFRHAIGHFTTGVTIVSTVLGKERYGTTVSAISSLSVEPPMLIACLNLQSTTGQAISQTGHFAVDILGEQQAELARRFGSKGEDRFVGDEHSTDPNGLPLFPGAIARLECRVVQELTAATHNVFLAEVDRAHAPGGRPLAYFSGRLGGLELLD